MTTKVKKIIKRDGRIVDFDINRIRYAIKKAMISVNQFDEKTLDRVVRYVVRLINEKYDEENIPHVENIQDMVEFTLVKYDLYEVAKAYILYRREREKIRREKMLLLNKEYLDEVDKAFSLNAIRLLAARYLLKNEEGKVIETPKQLFQRVASLIVIPDLLHDERIFSKDGGYPTHPYEEFDTNKWEFKLGLGYDEEQNTYKVTWNRYHLERMKDLYDRLNKEGKMKIPWSKYLEMMINNEFDNYYQNYLEYYNLMVSKKFMPNSPTLFNAGTRLGQLSACFLPDQVIVTSMGEAPIISLNVGDRVLTHEGRYKVVKEKFVRNYIGEILYIDVEKLPKETLMITPEHPVLAIKKEMITHMPNKNILLKEKVIKSDSKNRLNNSNGDANLEKLTLAAEWIPINELEVGDYLAISFPKETRNIEYLDIIEHIDKSKYDDINEWIQRNYNPDNKNMEITISSYKYSEKKEKPIKRFLKIDNDTMLLFGYYLSQGDADNTSVRFTFSTREETKILKVVKIIKEKFGILDTSISMSIKPNWIIIKISNSILGEFFSNLLGNEFNKKRIPEWIIFLPTDKQENLLRGLFEGGGSLIINKKPIKAKLLLENRNLIYITFLMFLRLGIVPKIDTTFTSHKGRYYPIYIVVSGEDALQFIEKTFDIKFNNKKKQTKQTNIIWGDNKVFLKIKNIRKVPYIGPVYNLEVEEDHSYSANLVAVHNCFVLEIKDDINSIMQAAKDAAIIFKSGGGIGINYSELRPEGDTVFSTAGVASGPCSFMRIIDTVTDVIKQGGCISVNNYLFTSFGLIRPDSIPIQNPRIDNPIPLTVYDGINYVDAIAGSLGPSQEIMEILTEYGHKVKVTYNELMASIDNNGDIIFRPTYTLKKGDYLVLVLGNHIGKEIIFEEVKELNHNINSIRLPDILDTDLAEILGFYTGSGFWNNEKLILKIRKSEKNKIEYISKKIEEVFNLKKSEIGDKKAYIYVTWSSNTLKTYFDERGWKKTKDGDNFMLDDILMSKKEVLAAYIRGLFKAVGHVNRLGQLVFNIDSEKLATQIQIALLSLGILSILDISKSNKKVIDSKKSDTYLVEIIDRESIDKFSSLVGYEPEKKNSKLGNKITKETKYLRRIPNVGSIIKKIYLDIKKNNEERADKFYEITQAYINNEKPFTYEKLKQLVEEFNELRPLLDRYKNYVFTKIVDIKRTRQEVFHLETLSGKYVANGFLIHNKRRGANMGILEVWHPDIEKFITSKSTQGILENFNISVMIAPSFWEKYHNDENYILKNPRDNKPWKEVNARHLFRLIAENAWKTGDPGVLFLDNINKRNILKKGLGQIKSTNPCITGDTLIYTPKGIYQIKELENRHIEICLDDRAILPIQEEKPIGSYRARGDVIKTGIKHVIRIETEHGLILKLTPDHMVRVAEEINVPLDNSPHKFKLKWKEARKLKKGDMLLINSTDMWEDWKERIDGINLSWKLGYIVGYTVGRGYVDRERMNIQFDQLPEKDLVVKISKMIEETLGIKPEIYQENDAIWLRIRDREVIKFFNKHGISLEKSHLRKIPKLVFRSPRRFVLGFITGILERDGRVKIHEDNNVSISISSSSLHLLRDLQHILMALGIPSKLCKEKSEEEKIPQHIKVFGEKVHELVISNENAAKLIEIVKPNSKYMIDNLKEIIAIFKKKDFNNERFLTRVTRIDEEKEEEVYDIHNIPGHHAFIANGIMVHNCGEEPLYPYESCNLGSINLYAFIEYNEEGRIYFNWKEYKRVIQVASRFLDNVIDVNKYPVPRIAEMSRKTRKIGLGLMGLADTLYALKVPYNSEKGFKMMKKFAEYLTYYSMKTSVERAIERGSFPAYTMSSYIDGEMPVEGYYNEEEWTLDWKTLNKMILENGIRNAETTTIAPTGSISMIADTSSGIEPQFALVFEKRVSVGTFFYVDSELERTLHNLGLYNEHILKAIADNGGSLQELDKIPKRLKRVFLVAYDIPWWDHVRAQAEISKWICAAVSKTINMPNWVSVDDIEKAYIFAYKLGNKGITIYRDGSKSKQVLVTPSQRKGTYITTIDNKTLEIMKEMKIPPPVLTKKEKKLVESTMNILVRKPQDEYTNENNDISKEYTKCPECRSSNVIYTEGCLKCLECGWSLCVTS